MQSPLRLRIEAKRRIARPANPSEDAYSYTLLMAHEDTVLEDAMDNLKEAGQRIRATQSLMRLSMVLAMTEAAAPSGQVCIVCKA